MGDAINYVRGINHSAWRTVAKYYIAWYKTGSKPTLTVSCPLLLPPPRIHHTSGTPVGSPAVVLLLIPISTRPPSTATVTGTRLPCSQIAISIR